MKLLVQLFFFGIAVLLTFFAVFTWFALIQDATPQGLLQVTPIDNYTDENWMFVLIGGFVSPFLSVIIFFMLWKTNFFTKNKQN
jgi:uncharacterized BrkB/YihY/UPF0761 family membrane protein